MISIHALLKRATTTTDLGGKPLGISIHALLKRATNEVQKYKNVSINFNSRSPEESDALVSATKLQSNLFQFTLS